MLRSSDSGTVEKPRVLVTGATGFIGRGLCLYLTKNGFDVYGSVRVASSANVAGAYTPVVVGEIGPETDWSHALSPRTESGSVAVDCVIHCAAKSHVLNHGGPNLADSYREINVLGAARLAECAIQVGVKQFIFLSSVNVLGRKPSSGLSLRASDPPSPQGLSGRFKWQAEQELRRLCEKASMSLTTVRLPLVYGPMVKGNLALLLTAVSRGFPLPLGGINNRRSMIGLDNLVNFLAHCILNDRAFSQTFLVSDTESHSTSNIVRIIASGMGKKAFLLPIPMALIRLFGLVSGKGSEVASLVDSLHVDDSLTRSLLSWRPPYTSRDGMRAMAEHFLNNQGS